MVELKSGFVIGPADRQAAASVSGGPKSGGSVAGRGSQVAPSVEFGGLLVTFPVVDLVDGWFVFSGASCVTDDVTSTVRNGLTDPRGASLVVDEASLVTLENLHLDDDF